MELLILTSMFVLNFTNGEKTKWRLAAIGKPFVMM